MGREVYMQFERRFETKRNTVRCQWGSLWQIIDSDGNPTSPTVVGKLEKIDGFNVVFSEEGHWMKDNAAIAIIFNESGAIYLSHLTNIYPFGEGGLLASFPKGDSIYIDKNLDTKVIDSFGVDTKAPDGVFGNLFSMGGVTYTLPPMLNPHPVLRTGEGFFWKMAGTKITFIKPGNQWIYRKIVLGDETLTLKSGFFDEVVLDEKNNLIKLIKKGRGCGFHKESTEVVQPLTVGAIPTVTNGWWLYTNQVHISGREYKNIPFSTDNLYKIFASHEIQMACRTQFVNLTPEKVGELIEKTTNGEIIFSPRFHSLPSAITLGNYKIIDLAIEKNGGVRIYFVFVMESDQKYFLVSTENPIEGSGAKTIFAPEPVILLDQKMTGGEPNFGLQSDTGWQYL